MASSRAVQGVCQRVEYLEVPKVRPHPKKDRFQFVQKLCGLKAAVNGRCSTNPYYIYRCDKNSRGRRTGPSVKTSVTLCKAMQAKLPLDKSHSVCCAR